MTEAINHPLLTPSVIDRVMSRIPPESCASALLVCRQWRDSVEHIRLNPHREHVPELSLALRAPAYAKRFPPPDDRGRTVVDHISLDAAAHNAVVTDGRPASWFVTRGGEGGIRSYYSAPMYGVSCHTINRSGSQAAFGMMGDGVILSGPDHDSGQFTILCARPSHPTALAFSGDGLRLVVAGSERHHDLAERITVWDTQRREYIWTILQSETGIPRSMSLDYSGAVLAVGSYSRVTVWDLQASGGPRAFPSPPVAPKGELDAQVAVSDNGKIVGIAANCGLYSYRRISPEVWDLAHIATTPGPISNFSMSGSGAVMASSPYRGNVTLWNALNVPGFHQRIFRESNNGLRLALTPDACCLAVSQADGSLRVYQMAGKRTFVGGIAAALSRWWATPSFISLISLSER